MTEAQALLEIEDVVTLYGGGKRLLGKRRPVVRGVDGVSLSRSCSTAVRWAACRRKRRAARAR